MSFVDCGHDHLLFSCRSASLDGSTRTYVNIVLNERSMSTAGSGVRSTKFLHLPDLNAASALRDGQIIWGCYKKLAWYTKQNAHLPHHKAYRVNGNNIQAGGKTRSSRGRLRDFVAPVLSNNPLVIWRYTETTTTQFWNALLATTCEVGTPTPTAEKGEQISSQYPRNFKVNQQHTGTEKQSITHCATGLPLLPPFPHSITNPMPPSPTRPKDQNSPRQHPKNAYISSSTAFAMHFLIFSSSCWRQAT